MENGHWLMLLAGHMGVYDPLVAPHWATKGEVLALGTTGGKTQQNPHK